MGLELKVRYVCSIQPWPTWRSVLFTWSYYFESYYFESYYFEFRIFRILLFWRFENNKKITTKYPLLTPISITSNAWDLDTDGPIELKFRGWSYILLLYQIWIFQILFSEELHVSNGDCWINFYGSLYLKYESGHLFWHCMKMGGHLQILYGLDVKCRKISVKNLTCIQ
jgi:hypothetical protein